MSDRYTSFANSAAGKAIVKRLGLPDPTPLRRYRPGDPEIEGPVLVGGSGRLAEAVRKLLDGKIDGGPPYTGLVFDATGITDSAGLRGLYDFFHPHARSLRRCGRVIVLGTAPEDCPSPREATAQRALEGFVRSVGKEF